MTPLLHFRFAAARCAVCALFVLLCLSAPLTLPAQDPTLDLSFSEDGKWFYSDGPSYDLFTDMLIDANERIILVGYTNYDPDESGKNRGVVVRLLPNGIPDPSFSGGKVYIDFPNSTDEIQGAAFDHAGNIILCGQTNIASGAVYKLLSSNLTLDPNFGTGGRVVLPAAAELNDVAVLPSGKIVVAGWGPYSSSDDDILVAQFLANGALDSGFSPSGYRLYGSTEDEYANQLVVQPNGNIVVSGYQRRCSGDNCLDPIITRIMSDGQLDSNFGIKVISGAINEAKSYSVALQNIGGEARILLSGYHEPSTDDYAGFIMRFRDNGNPDGSFNNSSTGFVSLGDMNGCVMSVQGNNKIMLASYRIYFEGSNVFSGLRLMRLNADGTKDTSFGNNGIYDTQISNFLDGPEVVKTLDNKIYVAGGVFPYQGNYSDVDGFVARFTTGPTTAAYDLAESLGIRAYPNPVTERLTVTSASMPLQRVSIVGITGQVLATYDALENVLEKALDMSGLSAGLYFVQIVTAGPAGAVSLPVLKL